MVLSYYISDPIKSHVDGSRPFCFNVPLKILFDAVLYVSTGVGGCWWTIYDREVLMDVALCQFSNNFPNSASGADTITLLIILHSTCTRTFSGEIYCISVLHFGRRKKYPQALLRASGS